MYEELRDAYLLHVETCRLCFRNKNGCYGDGISNRVSFLNHWTIFRICEHAQLMLDRIDALF